MIHSKSVAFALTVVALLCTASARPAAPLASLADIERAEHGPLWTNAEEGHWNTPRPPFTIMGNVHYVGTEGIGVYLITSPKGHILIDGALPQSAPQIIANIAKLGYNIRDVRYLMNSHAHIDHAGGLAALQRASHAQMIASAADQPILEDGGSSHGVRPFPRIRIDRVIRDGEVVRLGPIRLTAHLTPGHTPGCTTWTMPVMGPDGQPHQALFQCSLTVAGQSLVPEAYKGVVADYRASFAKMHALNADIFLANHAVFFGLADKRAKQIAGDVRAFVDASEIQRFTTNMENDFNAELGRQQAAHK